MSYKGIILAGGSGTRLYPITKGTSKQLLPIYDKPMIYYSLSVLMLAGIQEILLISTPRDIESYQNLLGDGSDFGIKLEYIIQKKPHGLAQSFILGEDFIGDSKVALMLGDNIFYGEHFSDKLKDAYYNNIGATIFGYHVDDPSEFGVIEFDKDGNVISLEEKPKYPKSNYAITGLYFYDNKVIEYAKSLKPSSRGELEITDINAKYLKNNNLSVNLLGRGFAWLDTGSPNSLLEAGRFVQTIEERQGLKIGCLEEIALNNGWLKKETILSKPNLEKTSYGRYLKKIITNL